MMSPSDTYSVYAEINKKQLYLLENGGRLKVPVGVEFKRKQRSRALFFECADRTSFSLLTDFLDENGIVWQEN